MSLIERLTHRNLLNQYASVMEQILMSGSNMLASIVVLKAAGVAQFGIYSFIFVLATLVSGVFGTLLHRQMMLQIASEEKPVQRRVFLATIAIEVVGLVLFLLILVLMLSVLSLWFDISSHRSVALSGAIYIVLYVLFDAFKQYAYTTGNQVYSFRCTFIYVCVQVLLLGVIILTMRGSSYVVEASYAALSLGLLISLLTNRLCQKSLTQAQWNGWSYPREVLSGFFKQGRFSLLGMGITWAQNQSMNPFLMLISGPTVAGYFSIGRLLIMPMAVVSQGLVNSSTPNLRRLYKHSGTRDLVSQIRSYLKKTTLFSLLYVSLLLIAHFTGLLERFVPDYEEAQWYLAVWVVLISCSIVRFWNGQFFVVAMEFKFLLRVSIIALMVTVTGMLIFGLGFDSIRLALMSVIAGELTALAIYHRQQTIQLKLNHQGS